MTAHASFAPPPAVHILPPTSTLFEKAASAVDARLLEIPVPLRDLWRWDTCPATHLAWLAWALSVDVWVDSWSDDKKRAVIRNAFKHHRLKGTLAGQRTYMDLVGSTLYRAVRPPAKNFLGKSSTAAEKEALLEGLPQIRIFPARRNGNAGFRAFFNGKHGRFFADSMGNPDCFPREVDVGSKETTNAIYVYGNITKQLTWAKLSDNAERVMIPSTNTYTAFCNGFMGRKFFRKTDASERIVTIDLQRTSAVERLLYRFPVVPKLDPVNVVPFRRAEKGFAPRSVFCGTPIGARNFTKYASAADVPRPNVPPPPNGAARNGKRYFYRSGAKYRIYDTIYFKPRDLILAGRQATNFMGRERFGMPSFTAELKVIVPGKRPKWAADRFVGGFFYKAPKDNLHNMLAASRASKSARDDILIQTKVYRPLRIGTSLIVGAPLIAGQYTRS